MAYSPKAIRQIFDYVQKRYPDVQNGGIYANKSGYHNSRNGNKALGRPNDYSMGGPGQPPADLRGSADAASAIDLTPKKAATQHELSKRLYAVLQTEDPRCWPVREFFGSFDGNGVDGWSRWKGARVSSDSSHEWHVHISIYREYADDEDAMLGIAELICGVPLSQSETKHRPKPTLPKPTAPKPVPAAEEQPVPKPEPEKPQPKFTKVAFLNLPGTGNWQGASLAGGYWWAVEARKHSDGSEDCYVYRIKDRDDRSNLKPSEEPMRLNAGPGNKVHPTGWGVSDTGTVWVTWNGEGTGNDVITVDYEAGKTVTKSQVRQMSIFTDGNAQIAFDADNTMCSIREVTTKYDTHVLRSKADLLDGKDKALGLVRIPRRANRVVQGFTVAKNEGDNWELRVLVGLESKKSPFAIERWSFVKGGLIDTIPIPAGLGREPEGIDGDLIGMKTQDREGLDIYRYTT